MPIDKPQCARGERDLPSHKSFSFFGRARQLATAKELALPECARLFALLNMGLANNYILNWMRSTPTISGGLSPPFATAIWTATRPPCATRVVPPLNMTPLHPEYPSQASINATLASAILELAFGPVTSIPFAVTDVADRSERGSSRASRTWPRSKRMSAFGAVSTSGPRYLSARIWADRLPPTWSRTRSSQHVDVLSRHNATPRRPGRVPLRRSPVAERSPGRFLFVSQRCVGGTRAVLNRRLDRSPFSWTKRTRCAQFDLSALTRCRPQRSSSELKKRHALWGCTKAAKCLDPSGSLTFPS